MTVRPEVTGEANPGPEGTPTRRTQMDGCCSGRGGSPGLARGAFLLGLCSASVLCCTGSCGELATPGWTVQSKRFPSAEVDVQVFEGHFEAVLKPFLLSPY